METEMKECCLWMQLSIVAWVSDNFRLKTY